ncbi:hypothetical protein CU103_09145 [Phyllobacterium sophorae]|uniref:Uncharacterized protein n=1 Tax=Phyllobacterium sophorae TaxID=1520277 RepID=A0A2P7BFC7_9HYPH|nr:hypothetical protein CU103_09145 [Phyllobacterium sophorae]
MISCRFAFQSSAAFSTRPSESILERIRLIWALSIAKLDPSSVAVVVPAAAISDAILCIAIV